MQKYPVLQVMVQHGDELSIGAVAAVLVMGLGSQRDKLSLTSLVRWFGIAAATGVAVKNLTELNAIIKDALLPQ